MQLVYGCVAQIASTKLANPSTKMVLNSIVARSNDVEFLDGLRLLLKLKSEGPSACDSNWI